MRMLFVQLPHVGRVPNLVPIGIANVAQALQEVGVETEVYDIFALEHSRSDVESHLRKGKWDIIGVSAFSTQYEWAKWFVETSKKIHPDVLVIMGGPLATFNSSVVLEKTKTDICVISEGEESIKSITENMGDFSKVSGISYKSDSNQIINATKRPYIKDLDSLPFTNYDIFPMDIYFKFMGGTGTTNAKTINMFTARGCPYHCNFCSRTFAGSRFRSIDKVVEEIGILKDRYGIKAIAFGDELVLANKRRAYELCEKIKPLKVYWECQGRANVVDLDLLKTMKNAGCTSVGYGVESGSQKILDAMNKRSTVEQNEFAVINTRKARMTPVVQMIYGYPGEDAESINDTINFFDKIKFYPAVGMGICNVNLLTPLPGSSLYEDVINEGRISDEEEYLLRLEEGYYIDAPMQLNLTEFSDSELLENKTYLENTVKNNYLNYKLFHPSEWFHRYLSIASSILAVDGVFVMFREIIKYGFRVLGRFVNKRTGVFKNKSGSYCNDNNRDIISNRRIII